MRLFGRSLLILLSLLGVQSAFAEFNKGVDLRQWMGPIRNQSNKGWCYANVASDLLSYHFMDPQKGQSASAIFTALSYISEYVEGSDGVIDGGNAHRAVMAAKEIGVCPRRYDETLLWSGSNIGNLKAKLQFVSKLYDQKKDILQKRKEGHSTDILEKQFETNIIQLKGSKSILAPLLNEYTDSDITAFVEKTKKESFYFELAKLVCGKDRQIIDKNFRVYTANFIEESRVSFSVAAPIQGTTRVIDPKKNRLYAERSYDAKAESSRYTLPNGFGFSRPSVMLSSLLGQHIPVAISYYSAFLSKNYLEPSLVMNHYAEMRKDRHASVIVAERTDRQNGKKEFLIRNSWGAGCRAYDVVIQKDHCELGHIWVPADVLDVVIYSITAIDTREK